MNIGPYYVPDNTRLLLVRGLPGSGKSTLAKQCTGFVHFEADMWCYDRNGNYVFRPERAAFTHETCQLATRLCLEAGHNVVVSNTFTRVWEMQPYYDLGYITHEITMTGNYGNIHGLPDSVIDAMRARWEN